MAISNSGAVCVMAADAATAVGMPMAKIADRTRAEWRRSLPTFATSINPIDSTATANQQQAVLRHPSVLAQDLRPTLPDRHSGGGAGYDVDAFDRDSAEFARAKGKPLVAAVPQAGVAARFREQGLPVFTTEAEAVAALNQFLSHRELLQSARARGAALARGPIRQPGEPAKRGAQPGLGGACGFGGRTTACANRRTKQRPQWTIWALRSRLKGCSSDVVHKSEWDWCAWSR